MVVLVWQGMMMAMMAPAVVPWLRVFHGLSEPSPTSAGRVFATMAFGSGYFVAWLGYSVCAAAAQVVLAPASSGSSLQSAVLIAAGLFQFAPLKRACLTHCRNPLTYFILRWKNGPARGFRLGLSHGAYCVGCCWALMGTALALGVMTVWWMAALTAVVFIEQVLPGGSRIRVPLGVALIAAAMW